MYENCEALKKYADMMAKTTSEEDAIDFLVKYGLACINSQEIQDAITNYINECFDYAAIQDMSIHA